MRAFRARPATLLLAAAMAAAAAAPARAQAHPAAADQRPPLSAGLRPLLSQVRLLTVDGTALGGTVQRVGQDTLLVRPARFSPAVVAVPHVSVDSLWVRRSAWQRGALFGALAGTAFYVYVASTIDDHDPAGAALLLPTTTTEGVIFGLVFGSGTGAFAGSRFRRWSLHYARP
jgi:hypothetical protein